MTRFWWLGLMLGCPEEGWAPEGEVPFLEPREPIPELSGDQHRLLMVVIDVSCSMSGLGPLHYEGLDNYVSTLRSRYREGDRLGVTLFAEQVATGEDTFSFSAGAPPWIDLTDPLADLTPFWRRAGVLCPACTDAPEPPSLPSVGHCTNPSIGIAQAASALSRAGDENDFRGMLVVTGHGFNCGGGLSAALTAAREAYDDHGVHIWTLQPEFLGVRMDEVPYLTRGAGFFQFTEDANEVPSMYARAALGLPEMTDEP